MFEDILNPVDDNLLKLSKLLSDQVIGKNILINSKSSGLFLFVFLSITFSKSVSKIIVKSEGGINL